MITMLLNLLRYILIAAVLLTSNSQALMAVQLYLQPLVSAQTSVVEAGYDQANPVTRVSARHRQQCRPVTNRPLKLTSSLPLRSA